MAGPQLCAWGKLKTSGDPNMYPKPFQDLSGWNIRSIACGNTTFAIAADQSVITWYAPRPLARPCLPCARPAASSAGCVPCR